MFDWIHNHVLLWIPSELHECRFDGIKAKNKKTALLNDQKMKKKKTINEVIRTNRNVNTKKNKVKKLKN